MGNTTAATGKGFAIGSAALTALALMASYIEKVKEVGANVTFEDFSLMNPVVLVGLFIGACLPFVFAAVFYWIFNFVVEVVLGRVEKKMGYYHD